VADMASKAISVRSLEKPQDAPELLKDYEGTSFIGPNSMALSKINSNINIYLDCLYFTDSGPFGETTLDYNNVKI
jgi:hypothetical protein